MDGPPYEAVWVDDNPFERREIRVESMTASAASYATASSSSRCRHEAVEETTVARCLSKRSSTRPDVSSATLAASDFQLFEDDVRSRRRSRAAAATADHVHVSWSTAVRAWRCGSMPCADRRARF